MNFTKDLYEELKAKYKLTKGTGKESFEFKGEQMLTAYAKYLLQYLEPQFENDEPQDDFRVEHAKQVLRDAGYFVDNLWHTDDVKSRYLCDDDDAHHVLENALTNEATMEQIWFAIHMVADDNGLTKKEEE
jgi:hypothetical protein